jgi:hypothetical protein
MIEKYKNMHMIYKRFKIKWKEYPKMMPHGERLR